MALKDFVKGISGPATPKVTPRFDGGEEIIGDIIPERVITPEEEFGDAGPTVPQAFGPTVPQQEGVPVSDLTGYQPSNIPEGFKFIEDPVDTTVTGAIEDFIGPIRPAEEEADFIGPPTPEDIGTGKEDIIVDDSDSFGLIGDFEYDYKPLVGPDFNLFDEDADAITAPMVELIESSADLQKQGIDDIKAQRQLEFDFLNQKQKIALQQMQTKQNIPEAMRGQQFNQLLLNQFVQMIDVYTQLDLEKVGIDSELAQYKVALEERNFELANQLYDRALQRASLTYDITGEYIPPELDYMYSQIESAQRTIDTAEEGTPERAEAEKILESVSKQVSDLGFDADDRRGYKSRRDAYSEYLNDAELFLNQVPLIYQQEEITSRQDTMGALMELRNIGVWEGGIDITSIYDIFEKYPRADVSSLWGSQIDWEAYGLESPTSESVTLALRDIMLGGT